MEKTDNLFTIGEFSQLTGVNAKSLRYYEKIGVLYPAWIDPDNSYRYYTLAQGSLVRSIQHYVEAGVPLELLRNYIDPATQRIQFREQIAYGIEAVKQKIEKLEQFLEKSEMLQQKMSRCERLRKSSLPVSEVLPEKHYLLTPAGDRITYRKYGTLSKRFLLDIKREGAKVGTEIGILSRRSGDSYQNYIFADIQPEERDIRNDRRYFHLPRQHYLSTVIPFPENGSVEKYFPEEKPDIILLTYLFTEDFDFRNPEYELRWSADSPETAYHDVL